MNVTQFRAIIKDIRSGIDKDADLPVCAFQLQNRNIFTGSWYEIGKAPNIVLVIDLSDKECPPIYVDLNSVCAIALGGNTRNDAAAAATVPAPAIPLARAAKPTRTTSGRTGSATTSAKE